MTKIVISKISEELKRIVKPNMQEEMAKVLGVSQPLISKLLNGRAFGKKTAEKWEEEFGISSVFLLTGKGESIKRMTKYIKDEATKDVTSQPTKTEAVYYAPQLPVSAMAGTLTGFTDSIREWDLENVVVPIKGVDLVIPLSGDSMKPDYPEGCLLLTKRINEKAFIEWGKVFVLDTCNGVVIKQIYPSEEENKVKCVSINTLYPPFEVNKEDIIGWYIVLMIMARK